MSNFEVAEPILNSPFEPPKEHWWIVPGETPERRPGRRIAHYFYREGSFGLWAYEVAKHPSEVEKILDLMAQTTEPVKA